MPDRRLMRYGHDFGLISDDLFNQLREREILITKVKEVLPEVKIKPEDANPVLEKTGSSPISQSESLDRLAKRPDTDLKGLIEKTDLSKYEALTDILIDQKAFEQLDIETKYEGYIKRQQELIDKMEKLENVNIPQDFNFLNIKTISAEAREKLHKIKPRSIGQASRISGVSPADVSILLVYLKN